MAKRKNSETKPRAKPLIKRVLILPSPNKDDIPAALNWGELHQPENNERALALLGSYSYDAIVMQATAMAAEIIDYLVNKYRYASLIIVLQWELRYDEIPKLHEAGYKVINTLTPQNLPLGKNEMLWETYGN